MASATGAVNTASSVPELPAAELAAVTCSVVTAASSSVGGETTEDGMGLGLHPDSLLIGHQRERQVRVDDGIVPITETQQQLGQLHVSAGSWAAAAP